MRHQILALVFILLIGTLVISGCAKAPAEKEAMAPGNEVKVQEGSEDIAELEQDLNVDQVDLEVASLFEDY
jgi:PBP1b-binding outer membrane lipoprotein LpoB